MIKTIAVIAAVIIIAVAVVHFSGDDDVIVIEDDEDVSAVRGNEFTKIVEISAYEYPTVTYTAVPKSGSTFHCWTEDGKIVSIEREIVLDLASERRITAVCGDPDISYRALRWSCPTVTGYTDEVFYLPVSESAYTATMESTIQRRATVDQSVPTAMVTSDSCVTEVAAYLSEISAGMSSVQNADILLRFVQDAISYKTDIQGYGTDEFWALPSETIYNRYGDCEDTAVLLCALAEAMGMDSALAVFSDHMGAALALDGFSDGASVTVGDRTYVYCETATDSRIGLGILSPQYDIRTANIKIIEKPTESGETA